MEKLKQNVAGSRNRGDDKIASALELMKSNLLELAQRYVQQGVGGAKYTSAHIKDGYIEFRSPGGDYLAKADAEINVLEDTMRRFAYAMYLAGRPDLERPEYYKKLYKLIAPEGNRDLELFSKFSAGEITADQLKKQWAEKVISKEVPSTDKKSNWRLYNRSTDKPVQGLEFSNYTELDALERAKARVSPASSMTDFNLTYELRDIGTNTGRWNIVQQDTDETLEIVDAATRGEAVDYAHDKYSGGPDNVNFYVIPYTGNQESEPKPKLSRRAKLATQIAQPKDYVIVNKHSLLPFYTFRASTMSQAVDFAVTYLQDKNLDVGNFTVQRASNVKQAVDNAVDSRRMQQRLDPQVRDIDITIDQDSDQYEIVDRRTNRTVLQYRADDAADAGDKFNNWLRNQGMPEDTENYGYRPLTTMNESIDPISGAGAVPPRPIVKKINKDKIEPVEPVTKTQSYRSAIGQAISKKDLENMTSQIQVARKLGDSVMEMEDTPPEVIRALNQAAQKNGYKNWADVKANPRSSSAVITVAKLADTILKTTGPHHNKVFYKNKLDK
jgi:hypothetical protein